MRRDTVIAYKYHQHIGAMSWLLEENIDKRLFFLLQKTQFDTEGVCTFCDLFTSQNKCQLLSAVGEFIQKPVLKHKEKTLSLLNPRLVFVAPQIYNSHV